MQIALGIYLAMIVIGLGCFIYLMKYYFEYYNLDGAVKLLGIMMIPILGVIILVKEAIDSDFEKLDWIINKKPKRKTNVIHISNSLSRTDSFDVASNSDTVVENKQKDPG